jgi:ribosomal-protein-alanine N-acetyltransferase
MREIANRCFSPHEEVPTLFTDLHLETDRLIVRAHTMADLPALHGIVSQKEVMEFLPEMVMSRERAKQTLRWIIDCYRKNTPRKIIKFSVGLVEKSTGRLIGWCGLGPLEFDASQIEIYYGLSSSHWGRGFATEAARALLHYGLESIGLDSITALVKPENIASQRVIEKLGLIYQKRISGLPKKHRFFEGLLYYALTREEYLSRSTAG